jgi:hypothetical protein
VPATPAWEERDVLAHEVGITADLNTLWFGDGNFSVDTFHRALVSGTTRTGKLQWSGDIDRLIGLVSPYAGTTG